MKILFTGSSGFPIGLAEVNKQLLISKSLMNVGAEVIVFCNNGANSKKTAPPKKGVFEGVRYKYTSVVSYNPQGRFFRKINKIIGEVLEIPYLLIFKGDVILINSRAFISVLKCFFIAKLTGAKTFLIITEDPVEMSNANSILNRINNKLFHKFAWRMVNGAFPISEYLIERVKAFNPRLPIFKIPTLVDLETFNQVPGKMDEKYFLFCGAAAYFDIIKFIINSFNIVENSIYKLILVINGSDKDLDKIENEIRKSNKKELIKVRSYLKYYELIGLYKNASALLIPLRPILRDAARFPHKIGEYTASGNPIITTNFGEIKYYFTHLENAIISEQYDTSSYSKWMKFAIDNPEKAQQIGANAIELSEKEFNYKIFGEKIIDFIHHN